MHAWRVVPGLIEAIRKALLTDTYEPLATFLASANEINCPLN
ncbi:MAG TPA: hypothetical protein VFI25_17850 [Planctomycetota bacterium]|nr:hypothetical protein [Planctomycetota bacterium]